MAKLKPHEMHADMMSAFETADANTPRTKQGNGSYGFSQATGKPRSPAQMASAQKAADTSAANRSAQASVRNATAPDLGQAKTTSAGGLGLNKPKGLNLKKGLLGM
jgi:hypothetical protein